MSVDYSSDFRRCLEECDVAGLRRLWLHVFAHLPQPKNDAEVLIMLHRARTQADSMPLKLRAYSHRWLLDCGYPSGLSDSLKPQAERLYPRIVEAVGISVNTSSDLLRPIVPLIQAAMSNAVMDAYAHRKTKPAFVRVRMAEARDRVVNSLLGTRRVFSS